MSEEVDPEPVREPAADEPRTPMWLPALGALLFLAVIGWWLGGPAEPTQGAAASASASAATSGSAAPGRAAPPSPPPVRGQ